MILHAFFANSSRIQVGELTERQKPILTRAKGKMEGYRVVLHFLSLPTVELAKERVRQRVKQGGHHIPADVIERRFQRGHANLERYKPIADDWKVWDTAFGNPELIDEKDQEKS